MWTMNFMHDTTAQMLAFLNLLLILFNATNARVDVPINTSRNVVFSSSTADFSRVQISPMTTSRPPISQTSTFYNKSVYTTRHSLVAVTELISYSSSTNIINKDESAKIAVSVTTLICFSASVVVLIGISIYLMRENINNAYFRLPCIHTLSATKRSRDNTPLSYSPIHKKFTAPEEFPVDQLYDIYMQKHALDDLTFSIEFQNIPDFEELSCTAANREIVASKNRFLNILPIDNTRVVLNLINNDPATDYINGNYISGYKCSNKFIATQGPTLDTCEDFWRMIWDLKLKSIVMLTNITEGSSRMTKCHQYWPDINQTINYGPYKMKCIDQQCLRDYEKRFFHLTKISGDKELLLSSSLTKKDVLSDSIIIEPELRLIVQYHYKKWKDMDVPDDSHTLLHLIREVNEQTSREQYPIVVHCTAGVGRTGTYIAIDAIIDQIKQEGKVDVYNFVLKMRSERHLMVQTVKQYVFIYRSLLEHYLYGSTRIQSNTFSTTYFRLKDNKKNLLISEYNKLQLLPAESVSHRDAHLPSNISKNRNTQIVPHDDNRVRLSRILGHPYINASFIEGYSQMCSFIITQDPLAETIEEFWRIFIEQDSNCIVQLHTVFESSPKCATYYPNDFDTVMKVTSTSSIKLVNKEIIDEKLIIRQLRLNDTREILTKTIDHYEYLLPVCNNDEYENGVSVPTEFTSNLLDLIDRIRKRLGCNNQDRYITVHCGNGGPSCSIFCMSFILLEQLKKEDCVDIFQGVRALQRQRPAMINSFAQYEYVYDVILKSLEESIIIASVKSSLSLNHSIYDNDQEAS